MHNRNCITIDDMKVITYHLQHIETELTSLVIKKHTDLLLNEINLIKLSNKIEISTDSNLEQEDKFISYIKYSSNTSDSSGTLLYNIEFELKGTSIKSEPFRLLDAEEIEQFTNVVAVRSMWPYLREILSSVTSKMCVPTIEIPTIDIMETYKNDNL